MKEGMRDEPAMCDGRGRHRNTLSSLGHHHFPPTCESSAHTEPPGPTPARNGLGGAIRCCRNGSWKRDPGADSFLTNRFICIRSETDVYPFCESNLGIRNASVSCLVHIARALSMADQNDAMWPVHMRHVDETTLARETYMYCHWTDKYRARYACLVSRIPHAAPYNPRFKVWAGFGRSPRTILMSPVRA